MFSTWVNITLNRVCNTVAAIPPAYWSVWKMCNMPGHIKLLWGLLRRLIAPTTRKQRLLRSGDWQV